MPDSIAEQGKLMGVLLHPTSLPNSPICGSFGQPTRDWLKLLSANEIGVWQILPLAPCDVHGSPYSSPSSFALNPWLLDAMDLANEGFVSFSHISSLPGNSEKQSSSVDFELADIRSVRLGEFLRACWPGQSPENHLAFKTWSEKQFWLEDYVFFAEMSRQSEGNSWWKWPNNFALNSFKEVKSWKKKNNDKLMEHKLLQWHLYRQWQAVKKLANELNIVIFGDLPFYVSHNSADVWSNKSLFSILPGGELVDQSGVPPDYFSSTGQLWGTPVYKWEKHICTNFEWWKRRVEHNLHQVNLLRLDHFRALDSYWSVPGDKLTAEEGSWRPSPGLELLDSLKCQGGDPLPIVAEDLGVITSEVEDLRDKFQLPGMKVLQFAFDGDPKNVHLPENIYGNRWVVYSGTHDNPTTLEWWNNLDQEAKDRVNIRTKSSNDSPVWQLLEIGLATEAKLFIAPLQDLLCLGSNARLNKPGTVGENWNWRLTAFNSDLQNSLKSYGDKGRFWGRSLGDGASSLSAF